MLRFISFINSARLPVALLMQASGVTWGTILIGLYATWDAIVAGPVGLQMLVAVLFLIVTAFFFASVLFFSTLPSQSDQTPRSWKWYRYPIHKLSWNFSTVFSFNIDDGVFHVRQFICSFRVNRGDGIRPKRGLLDCKHTGRRIPLYVECGNPYVRAELIEFIPKGKWFYCCAAFRKDGIDETHVNAPYGASEKISPTAEEFFERYSDFELVFEYDGKYFRKTFSRSLLETIINRARARNIRKPDPTPRRKVAVS